MSRRRLTLRFSFPPKGRLRYPDSHGALLQSRCTGLKIDPISLNPEFDSDEALVSML